MLALRKHSHALLRVHQNNTKSDPGAPAVWVAFSMLWMFALPQYSQHPKSYKIASKVILNLMMHLVSLSMVWMIALPSHSRYSQSLRTTSTRILELVMSLEALIIPVGYQLHISERVDPAPTIGKLTPIEFMVCLDAISNVLDACSAKAFSLPKVYSNLMM